MYADIVYSAYMSSIQYTVRNIPQPVDRALRQRAKRDAKSFNQTVIDALKQATGTSDEPVVYHDLDWFAGGQVIDQKAFDRAQKWLDSLPNDML